MTFSFTTAGTYAAFHVGVTVSDEELRCLYEDCGLDSVGVAQLLTGTTNTTMPNRCLELVQTLNVATN